METQRQESARGQISREKITFKDKQTLVYKGIQKTGVRLKIYEEEKKNWR